VPISCERGFEYRWGRLGLPGAKVRDRPIFILLATLDLDVLGFLARVIGARPDQHQIVMGLTLNAQQALIFEHRNVKTDSDLVLIVEALPRVRSTLLNRRNFADRWPNDGWLGRFLAAIHLRSLAEQAHNSAI